MTGDVPRRLLQVLDKDCRLLPRYEAMALDDVVYTGILREAARVNFTNEPRLFLGQFADYCQGLLSVHTVGNSNWFTKLFNESLRTDCSTKRQHGKIGG